MTTPCAQSSRAKASAFYTSHTIKEARSQTDDIESVVLVGLDDNGQVVDGSEKEIACDGVVLAIGMVPTVELTALLQCELTFDSARGGWAPVVDEWMRSSVDNVFIAGDAAGYNDGMATNPAIAEAQGRIAGIAAAESLGAIDSATAHERRSELAAALDGAGASEVHSHWKRWMHALINAGGLGAYICQCEEVTKGGTARCVPASLPGVGVGADERAQPRHAPQGRPRQPGPGQAAHPRRHGPLPGQAVAASTS